MSKSVVFLNWVTVAIVAAVAGCSTPAPPLQVSGLAVEPNPNERVPLAAILTCKTDRPTQASLTISDGVNPETVMPPTEFATNHELPVLGLRPGREHTISIALVDKEGSITQTEPLSYTTEPLPEGFPPIERRVSRPAKMEPGYTFFNAFRWSGFDLDRDYGVFIAVDAQGEVVWYYQAPHPVDEARRYPNGNLVYTHGREGYMVEIDMLGNEVRRWHSTGIPKDPPEGSIPVETDTFHHDLDIMPDGDFLMLSTEVREFQNYPSRETDPEAERRTAELIGDVIVEFNRDGVIQKQWHLLDILDPYRIGYGSLSTNFYAAVYKNVLEEPAKDWSHTNSIVYDEQDDAILISIYHQDAVIKLDYDTGEPQWILGPHANWGEKWRQYLLEPINGDGWKWNYHQHAASFTPQRTVLMYDNGTHGASAFEDKPPQESLYSRVVEFKVDEENMTVEKVWSYGGPEDEMFFSSFICGAEWMPETGNVLVADGGRTRTKDGKDGASPIAGHHWARVFEVTHESPAEKVWEIVIDDPEMGWAVYRSVRYPSLYPNAS